MNNKLSCTPWTRLVVFNTEFGVVEVQGPMLSRQIHLRVVRGPIEIPQFRGQRSPAKHV